MQNKFKTFAYIACLLYSMIIGIFRAEWLQLLLETTQIKMQNKFKKKAIINNQNAPAQTKLKSTGDIISFVNTLKFSKRNNETSTVREWI